MIDPQTRAAVEAVPVASLLPPRAQSRVESLDGRVAILDALDLGATADGDRACVAVVRVLGSPEHRDVVVPGRMHEGQFVRDAGVARYLRSQESAAFTVEIIGSGIPAGHAREIDVDQSNDSVIVGDDASAVMVKWQLDAVPSPAPSRLRSLMGTDLTPPLRGVVRWRDAAGVERTLMTAADYLPGADDGWTWAVELVRSHARGERVDAIEPFAVLGEMTARMHLAFAGSGVESWDGAALSRLHDSCRAHLDEALRLIDGDEGDRLRARADRIAARMDALAEINSTPVIDIHGDFHIGQVLRW
ncbi:MAG: hypothetical protein ACO3LZ_09680, partial [Candidatus Nanopelagicales bacterium]